jgi:drug/metabolite transporter (DMT)-like permease
VSIKCSDDGRASGSHSLRWGVILAFTAGLLAGCNGAPSRNILGSYFPSWMVCALAGLGVALLARMLFRVTGLLDELPAPFVVLLAIACATTFALWLVWLA